MTPKLDHIVIDRSEQLRVTAQAIARFADRVPVLAFANNHYAGYGSETSRQLAEFLAELDCLLEAGAAPAGLFD